MATSSNGTISSLGIGANIDSNAIVTQLVALERQPITQLQKDATKLQSKLSSWGQIKSALSSLGDAADALKTTASVWGAATATSSDDKTVKVTTSSGATAGSYSITVNQLASSQSLSSAAFTSPSATVGQGTLRIEMGSWNTDQSAFTAQSGATAIDVTIGANETSLTAIRDKINAAGSPVKAAIVTDTTGSRLVLTGPTGEQNAFRVTATDSDGNDTDATGLSALAYDPSAAIGSMTRNQTAANAQATINGLTVSSDTNKITAIEKMTFVLGAKTTSPVSVNVAQDTDGMTKAVTDFTSAYNKLIGLIRDQTAYNAATKTGATLQGDSTARTLQSQLRSLIGSSSSASSVYGRLSDIGISIAKEGTLSVDTSKLGAALSAQPGEVRKLLGGVSTTSDSQLDGLATRISSLTDQVVGSDGEVSSRTNGLQSSIDRNSKRQSDLEDRVALVEARLRAQYTALDTTMAKLNTLSSYVTQQLSALK